LKISGISMTSRAIPPSPHPNRGLTFSDMAPV
jgi:hypothetical protein